MDFMEMGLPVKIATLGDLQILGAYVSTVQRFNDVASLRDQFLV